LLFGGVCSGVGAVFVGGLLSGIVTSLATGVPMESVKTHIISSESVTLRAQPISIHGHASPPPSDTELDRTPPPPSSLTSSGGVGVFIPIETPDATPVGTPMVTRDDDAGDFDAPSRGNTFSWCCLSSIRWKGWLPTVLKKVLNQSIRFPVHHAALAALCALTLSPQLLSVGSNSGGAGEDTRTSVPSSSVSSPPPSCHASDHPLLSFSAGFFAGVISIVLTQPIDVVKTRMQGIRSDRYGNSWQCFGTLLREEGPIAFCHGIVPRAIRTSLGAGVTFSLFPVLRQAAINAVALAPVLIPSGGGGGSSAAVGAT
jgi:hypothetical protein